MKENKNIKKQAERKRQEIFWYELSPANVEKKLVTSFKTGLAAAEARRRLEVYGENRLPDDETDGYLKILVRQIRSPLVYILWFAAFLSLAMRHYADLVIILFAVALNVFVGFIQEQKAVATLAELKKVIKPHAKVFRDGKIFEVTAFELVPGDVILIASGDRIPADSRLIEAVNLEISEAELTGESIPSVKYTEAISKNTPLADQENMVFMGTEVAAGRGRAVVVATSLATEIGQIAKMLADTRKALTPLQKSLVGFSRLVVWATFALSLLVLAVGLIRDRDFLEMLVTAVALAVAAIPEGLLISMTVILAVGMQRILRKKGLVRRMSATETLGSTSVICSDKTGTLTLGEMRVVSLVSASEELHGHKNISEARRSDTLLKILKHALLVNEAIVENPQEKFQNWKILGNLTDKALTVAGAEVDFDLELLRKWRPQLDEIPFDEKRKYAASLRKVSANSHLVYVKGAAEVVLNRCGFIEIDSQPVSATHPSRKILDKRFLEMTKKGLRVLGVAYRHLPASVLDLKNEQEVLNNLVFLGFIGLNDPLRQEVAPTLVKIKAAGLRPVIITGDHKLTTLAIAAELGLSVAPEAAVEGKDLDAMDDAALYKRAGEITLYARVTPAHKLRIIEALQKRGEVVAMTGDGVNDAPALKCADIGMSLGSGTEVAKSASDLVLLDNNFQTIVAAVEQGRVVVDNIRKVIVYLLSDSFSEIILITSALLLGLPLPLLPAQILWANLVTDGFPNLAFTVEPGERDIMTQKPRKRSEPLINREMKVLILWVGILTDIVFLLFFLRLYGSNSIEVMRTMVFAAFGFSSLVYAFSIKSLKMPLWRTRIFDNLWLIAAVGFGFVLQFLALLNPTLQKLLHTVDLPAALWLWVAGLSLIKLVAIELTKAYFRFKTNRAEAAAKLVAAL